MNLTHLRKARALWAVALLGAIALAGVKVAAGQYTVYDDHAVQIGKAGAVSGGDTIGYVDDPNQNHPPNTNAVYNWDASLGTYSDGNGYHVEFTPAQLKVVHTALKSLLDDFGHDEADVTRVIHEVLDKLPDEHSIRAINLDEELRRNGTQ